MDCHIVCVAENEIGPNTKDRYFTVVETMNTFDVKIGQRLTEAELTRFYGACHINVIVRDARILVLGSGK
jgi:hypothetical protein